MSLLRTIESISKIQSQIFQVDCQIIDLMKSKVSLTAVSEVSEIDSQIRDLGAKKDLLNVFLEQRKGLLKILTKEVA